MRRRARKSSQRLTPDDWIRAAMDTLIENGSEGLRIARLADRLGVTSGSFYWHFKSRDDLRDRLLERWLELLEAAATAGGPGGRRAKLGELPSLLGRRRLPDLDLAMRAWARLDPVVAKQVERADTLRVRLSEGLLRAAGLDKATAAKRAPLMLWAHIGSAGADPAARGAALEELTRVLQTTARRARTRRRPGRSARPGRGASPPRP